MKKRSEHDDSWDWWESMQWPPGPLREFVPADWPATVTHEKWKQFCTARKAAAPKGWRLAQCRSMIHRSS